MGQKTAYRKKEGQERFDNRIALLVSDRQREALGKKARALNMTINELIRLFIDRSIIERGGE